MSAAQITGLLHFSNRWLEYRAARGKLLWRHNLLCDITNTQTWHNKQTRPSGPTRFWSQRTILALHHLVFQGETKTSEVLYPKALKISTLYENYIFIVWVKEVLFEITQKYFTHWKTNWKIRFIYNIMIEILRSLTFKSTFAFLKRPLYCIVCSRVIANLSIIIHSAYR